MACGIYVMIAIELLRNSFEGNDEKLSLEDWGIMEKFS